MSIETVFFCVLPYKGCGEMGLALLKFGLGDGTGEMAQWLRALTALSEDPGSIPSTHMAAHNCL